jgi:peptide/nickel transport system permease protein
VRGIDPSAQNGISASAETGRVSPESKGKLQKRTVPLTWGGAIAIAGLLVLFVAALFGAALAPHDPATQDLTSRLEPPVWNENGSWSHLLGTDSLGRDVFSRLIVGSRVTLLFALGAVVLEGLIGVIVGLVGGYSRGTIGWLLMRWTDIQMAFPSILLWMTVILIFGNDLPVLIIGAAVNGWMIFARVTRTNVVSLKERSFVESAIAGGASTRRIIGRHVLPHLVPQYITLFILEMARVTLAEAAVSFIGIGVQPPNISWGLMLGEGRDLSAVAYHLAMFPGLCISLTVIALNLLARWIEPLVNPLQQQRLSGN